MSTEPFEASSHLGGVTQEYWWRDMPKGYIGTVRAALVRRRPDLRDDLIDQHHRKRVCRAPVGFERDRSVLCVLLWLRHCPSVPGQALLGVLNVGDALTVYSSG